MKLFNGIWISVCLSSFFFLYNFLELIVFQNRIFFSKKYIYPHLEMNMIY